MAGAERIAAIIEPILTDLGYDLVRVALTGAGTRHVTLQIMADRRDGAAMGVDDCSKISRAVSPALDVADPIKSAYSLEVSSPGIDRPLVKPADYERFAGQVARIELDAPIEGGRKRFQGPLKGLNGEKVLIEDEAGTLYELPLSGIVKAKLVLTDALLKSAKDLKLS